MERIGKTLGLTKEESAERRARQAPRSCNQQPFRRTRRRLKERQTRPSNKKCERLFQLLDVRPGLTKASLWVSQYMRWKHVQFLERMKLNYLENIPVRGNAFEMWFFKKNFVLKIIFFDLRKFRKSKTQLLGVAPTLIWNIHQDCDSMTSLPQI